jgi:hypothetical protein
METFDTFFPLSTEAVGASRYLAWPERAPSRQKQDRRGQGAQYERNFLFGKPRPVGGELQSQGRKD